jgi:hypothetical protein
VLKYRALALERDHVDLARWSERLEPAGHVGERTTYAAAIGS